MYKTCEEKLLNILYALNLNKNEALLYLASLEIGKPKKAGELASETGINRSTAYNTLYNLKDKGFMDSVIKNDIIHFIATPLNTIIKMLEKKENEYKIKKELLRRSAKDFSNLVNKKNDIDQIKLYIGRDKVMDFYHNIIPWEQYHYCIFSAESYAKLYPDDEYFGTGGLETIKKLQGKCLLSPTNHPAHFKAIEMIKLCPSFNHKLMNEGLLKTDTMIFSDFVGIVHLDPENLHAVQIRCKSLINSYKNTFDKLWDKGIILNP